VVGTGCVREKDNFLEGCDIEVVSIERVVDEYVHSWVLYANDGTHEDNVLASVEVVP
jgi:hypothetical protein